MTPVNWILPAITWLTIITAGLRALDIIGWSWWIITAPFLFVLYLNIALPIMIGTYRGLKIRIVNRLQ